MLSKRTTPQGLRHDALVSSPFISFVHPVSLRNSLSHLPAVADFKTVDRRFVQYRLLLKPSTKCVTQAAGCRCFSNLKHGRVALSQD